LILVENYVYRRIYEPETLMHCGIILAANDRKAEGRKLLEESLQSSFELGPVISTKVRMKLEKL